MPVHDRGKVLTQAALVLAGGGESCLDIKHLRAGPDLFGSVPSDTTVARTFGEVTPEDRARVAAAVAPMRAQVWSRAATTAGYEPVLLDIDASLVEIHSENKEQTAATFKGGFGFHPMFCFADATGETLAALLRPGNAGANTVADHVKVLDQAIAQLPGEISAGHNAGDDKALVERAVAVRADSAGCTEGFLRACRECNVGFFVTARSNAQVTEAIDAAVGLEAVWQASLRPSHYLEEMAPEWLPERNLESFDSDSELVGEHFLRSGKVECLTLTDLMDRFDMDTVDYVNVDAEGFDDEVVYSIDFDRFRPTILCIETSDLTRPRLEALEAHLTNWGYRFARTFGLLSRVYVHSP